MPTNDVDELEGLSDEERAALEDEIEEETVSDPEEDEAEEVAAADDAPAAEDAATADEEDDEEDEDDDDDDRPPGEFQPEYRADPVEDYDERMSDITERKEKLVQDFNDGELDLAEYNAQRDAIEAEAADLRDAKLKADIAAEAKEQRGEQRWQWEQENFLRQKANKIYSDNTILMTALDTAVKELAADDANANREMAWFLEEADRRVRSLFGQPQDKKPQKKPRSKPGSDEIPPNLGDVPAADVPEVSGDEFAHLNALDGMELEAALRKLTPEQEARYLVG